MDSNQYKQHVQRLQEIEALVKNPETALGDIDALIEETKRLVTECYSYTRTLSDKVAELDKITPDSVSIEASA